MNEKRHIVRVEFWLAYLLGCALLYLYLSLRPARPIPTAEQTMRPSEDGYFCKVGPCTYTIEVACLGSDGACYPVTDPRIVWNRDNSAEFFIPREPRIPVPAELEAKQ
jgi:hypothetical protein